MAIIPDEPRQVAVTFDGICENASGDDDVKLSA